MFASIPTVISTCAIGGSNVPAKLATRHATAIAAGLVLFAALPIGGSAPALGQSLSHYGSPLPRYYDSEGVQHWGSWAPPATDQKRALYLDAKPTRRHTTPRKIR